jgi:integrase
MAKRQRMTLRAACEAFRSARKDISESYRANAMRALERHIYPALGDELLDVVDRGRLLPVLTAMDAAGLHEYVRKTRNWLSLVYDWAIENEHAQVNPCAQINPEKAFVKEPVEHFAALELGDVPAFMQRLSLEGVIQSAVATRLLGLLWVRTQELRMMEWTEIDWGAELWRIPAGKMKRRKDHLVPLPSQAVALLRHMQARATGSPYVFPNDRRQDRPMSENSILYLIHRMGYKGRMTGHGFRTVASTWANEQGFNRDAIERQLSHTPDDKVRAAYNRAEYLPERRVILQAWADWLLPDQAAAGREQPA